MSIEINFMCVVYHRLFLKYNEQKGFSAASQLYVEKNNTNIVVCIRNNALKSEMDWSFLKSSRDKVIRIPQNKSGFIPS